MDAFLRALQARDGVARTHELLRAGVTKYALGEAVAAGRALRPSRGVIALPDADPLIVRCVSTNSSTWFAPTAGSDQTERSSTAGRGSQRPGEAGWLRWPT